MTYKKKNESQRCLYLKFHDSTRLVQSLSCVQFFATPWTAAPQASLIITNSWSLLKLMSIELVMPSNHLILCHPLFLLFSIFSNIWVFSNKSALCIRSPKYRAKKKSNWNETLWRRTISCVIYFIKAFKWHLKMINFNQKLPWTSRCKRLRLEHFLIPFTNLNSKWIKDQCKTKSHNSPRRNQWNTVSTPLPSSEWGLLCLLTPQYGGQGLFPWNHTEPWPPSRHPNSLSALLPSSASPRGAGGGREGRQGSGSSPLWACRQGQASSLERENTGHHQRPRSQQNSNQLRLQTFNKMSTSLRGFHQIPPTSGKVITCLKTTLDTNCSNIFVVVVDSLSCAQLSVTPFSVRGILQARILEWIAVSFSRGSS